MATSPLDYILQGARKILDKGQEAFRGDIGAVVGNQNLNATKTGIALNTALGLPKAAKDMLLPTRGYTEQQLKQAKPTAKEKLLAIPKIGAEIASIGEAFGGARGLQQFASTDIGGKLADVGTKISDFAKPKTAGEAAAMRIVDVVTLFPVGSLKISTTGASTIAKTKNLNKIKTVLKAEIPKLSDEAAEAFGRVLVGVDKVDDVQRVINRTKFQLQKATPVADDITKNAKAILETGKPLPSTPVLPSKLPPVASKVGSEATPLIQEAPRVIDGVKYNSFDEFVKAQTSVFHGTEAKFSPENIRPTKGTQGTGIYLSLDKNMAAKYAKGGEIIEYAGKDLKLADTSKFTKQQSAQFSDAYEKAVKQLGEHSDEATNQAYKSMGFDGKKITDTEIMLFDNSKLQTKSQLTDIWNKAQEVKTTSQSKNGASLYDNAPTQSVTGLGQQQPPKTTPSKTALVAPERLLSDNKTLPKTIPQTNIKSKVDFGKGEVTGFFKGYKEGAKTGKKLGIASQKNAQAIIVEQTKRKGELKLLREGIKIRDQKDGIIASLKDVTANANQSRKLVQQLIEDNLPVSERGKFMTMLRDAKTQKDVAKAFFRVDDKLEEITKKQIISDIKKTVGNLPENVDLDYKNKINEALSDVELTGHNKETVHKLEATQKYLQKQKAQGKDVALPQRILEKLQILGRTPKEQLTSSQLQGLKDEVELLKKLGQTKQLTKERLYQAEKDLISDDLASTIKPLNTKDVIRKPGQSLPFATKTTNKVKENLNRLKKARLSLRPIDGIAEITGMEKMKSRIDVDYGNYLNHNNDFIAERQAFLKEHPLNKQNMERIGIYAMKEQDGGYEKLANLGITAEEANNLTLTADEKAYYELGRKWFESDYEAVKAYMKDVYNKDVGKVKNYVSFQTDFDAMSELEIYERFGTLADDGVRRTKTVKKDFTETRTGSGNQKVKLDFDSILLRHKDNVAYMLNLGRDIKMYSEILNNPQIANRLGDLGTLAWKEWLDLMARKGGTEGLKQIAMLDALRRNLGVGVMSFKLSSALIQFSSLADAAGTIGGKWTSVGAYDVATSREARQFVLDNFPEIRQMIGDDIAFLELKDSFFGKVGEAGLKPLQKLDGLMRSTTAIGAYKKLAQDKGIPFDMKNPDKGIIAEVTKLVRQSQGSSSFKDTPLAITKGMFTGNKSVDKLIFQFQSFMLNRWENIERQIWREGFGKGNYAHGFMSFFWLILVAGLTEETLRRGSRKITDTITGTEREEDPLATSLWKNAVSNVPIVGNVINSLTYDSNPIPVINAGENVLGGLSRVMKGKETATKLRGGVDLGLGVANLGLGIPGTTQVGQIVKQLIKTEDEKKKTMTEEELTKQLAQEVLAKLKSGEFGSEAVAEEYLNSELKKIEKAKKEERFALPPKEYAQELLNLLKAGKIDEVTAEKELNSYLNQPEIADRTTKAVQERGKVGLVLDYGKAFTIDPGNAWKALTTAEKLGVVEGNLVEMQRFQLKKYNEAGGSDEYKKKAMAQMGLPWSEAKNYKLEHVVPVKAGGDTSANNLLIVTNAEHNSYTRFDNAAAKAVQNKKTTRRKVTEIAIKLKIDKTITINEALNML